MAIEDGKPPGAGGAGGGSLVLIIVVGGLAVTGVALGILLLISSSHLTMPAKCVPLSDPVLEIQVRDSTAGPDGVGNCFEPDTDLRLDRDDDEKNSACDEEAPNLYRSAVNVSVVVHRGGYGRVILSPESLVYDSSGDRWHINMSRQVDWASSYCLCAGCNGTEPGVCDECVPGTRGCDLLPPEYDCWVDVRTRGSGWPIFDAGVGRVRFTKAKTESNVVWWVFFWIFLGLFIVLLVAFIAVGIPVMLSSSSGNGYQQMPHTA